MELCVFKGHLAYQAYPFSVSTCYRAADLRQISAVFSHLEMKDWSVSNLSLLLHHDPWSRPQLEVRFCKRSAHCWLKSFPAFYPKWCLNLFQLVSGHQGMFKAYYRSPWVQSPGHWSKTSTWMAHQVRSSVQNPPCGMSPVLWRGTAVSWAVLSLCSCVPLGTGEHHGLCLRTSWLFGHKHELPGLTSLGTKWNSSGEFTYHPDLPDASQRNEELHLNSSQAWYFQKQVPVLQPFSLHWENSNLLFYGERALSHLFSYITGPWAAWPSARCLPMAEEWTRGYLEFPSSPSQPVIPSSSLQVSYAKLDMRRIYRVC